MRTKLSLAALRRRPGLAAPRTGDAGPGGPDRAGAFAKSLAAQRYSLHAPRGLAKEGLMPLAGEALISSTYQASDGAAYERWLGRWADRLAAGLIDFAGFSGAGALLPRGFGPRPTT